MGDIISKKGKRVAIGLSGGVDSAVSAFLLKKAGYDVTGVYFKCWEDETECNISGETSAEKVAKELGIKLIKLDFGDKFKDEVIDYFLNEYSIGRTPNPDIVCNQKVKFGAFYEWAMKNGFDYIATGHYAQTRQIGNEVYLLKGKDKSKDQSYFLYRISHERIKKVLFPVGNLTKNVVGTIARNNDISAVNRPESVDICFVGKSTLNKYLTEKIEQKKGDVLDSEGNVIGYHNGVWFFTIGQRKGFTLEKYVGDPMYVIEKNIKNNELIVGSKEKCFKESFRVSNMNWVSYNPGKNFNCDVRIRHLGKLHRCKVREIEDGLYNVVCKRKIFGVASGQSAVFYRGEVLIGGGVILG